MSIRLIELTEKPEHHREIILSKEEFLLGRGTDCDLRLNDNEVSRHHCMFRLQNEDILIMDLGSSNGTFVNELRVRSQTSVKEGDQVKVGPFRFVLEIDDKSGINWGAALDDQANEKTMKLSKLDKELHTEHSELPAPKESTNQ